MSTTNGSAVLEPVWGKDVKAYRSKLATRYTRWEKGVDKAPLLQWAAVRGSYCRRG